MLPSHCYALEIKRQIWKERFFAGSFQYGTIGQHFSHSGMSEISADFYAFVFDYFSKQKSHVVRLLLLTIIFFCGINSHVCCANFNLIFFFLLMSTMWMNSGSCVRIKYIYLLLKFARDCEVHYSRDFSVHKVVSRD